ncbi:MAG: type II secretion system secretin GspD, partial [Desulfuromonadales bacterium]|nr:type II secretion system secretin GspD [Desulfuromonadales bacterium]
MSKPTVSRIILWTTFLFLCLAPVLTLAQTQPQPSEEGRVTLDFKEVELADLIQTISELTGENFLYDETVKGKVTIVSPESMTLDEAYMLFHTVLNVKGYTVVPSGEVNKIVPLKNAKASNLPTVLNGRGKMSEQVITRVFRLKYLDASIVGPTVLIPLMPSYANVAAYAPSNSLIITDTGSNIERLAKIIHELDQPDSEGLIEIVPLVNSSAEELAKILNEVMSQPASAPARRRRSTQAGAANEPVTKIIPYPAGRSLILLASGDDMAIIKGLIAQMDQEMSGARSNINLFYLENADAVTLAATLNEILTGIKTEARTAEKGAAGSPLSAGPVTITADKPTNSLIINANPDDYRTIEEIITKLDIKRKQVYVEALILELSMDATQRLGVSLQGAANVGDDSLIIGSSNQNTGPVGIGDAIATGAAGLPSLLTQAVDGLLAGGFFNPITVTGPDGVKRTVPSLSVLIDISKTDSDVNLLSAPRLLTSDNEEAEIIVGSNVPIITGRLTDTGSSDGLAQSVSVERQDVALILRFTPQITEGDLVRLNVYQEITDIAPATQALVASVGSPSDVGPTFTKRVLRNTVLVENNRTVVLGGLIDTNVIESVTKVPILGDIPFLGWLFKRTSTQEEKTNLLIFINPTIIKDAEDLERVTGRNRTAAKGFLTE